MAPFLCIKWFSLGFFFTMWFFISNVITILYKIPKYFFLGIAFAFYNIVKYPSVVLYRFFKSITSSSHAKSKEKKVVTPKEVKLKKNEKSKREIKIEEKKLKKAKALEEKQRKLEKQKEEKIRIAEEKQKRKKRSNESYVNENIKREKKTLGDRINDALLSLGKIPKRIGEKAKKRWNNISFVKNAKNKKDINRQALLINFEGEDAKKSDKKLMYQYEGKNAEGKILKGYL